MEATPMMRHMGFGFRVSGFPQITRYPFGGHYDTDYSVGGLFLSPGSRYLGKVP